MSQSISNLVLGRNVNIVDLQHTHGCDYVTATHNEYSYFDCYLVRHKRLNIR